MMPTRFLRRAVPPDRIPHKRSGAGAQTTAKRKKKNSRSPVHGRQMAVNSHKFRIRCNMSAAGPILQESKSGARSFEKSVGRDKKRRLLREFKRRHEILERVFSEDFSAKY